MMAERRTRNRFNDFLSLLTNTLIHKNLHGLYVNFILDLTEGN